MGIASMVVFWIGALVYSASVGCHDVGFARTCGDDKVGGGIGLTIIFVALLLPLLYDGVCRRTLGKVVFNLEIVGRDGLPASRRTRIARAFAAWVPILTLAGGVLSTTENVGTAIGWVWFLYTILIVVLIVARQSTPYDWLVGSRVVYLGGHVWPGTQTAPSATET